MEKGFITLVSETFSIPPSELENALHFLEKGKDELIPERYLLFIQEVDERAFEELEGDWVDKNRPVCNILCNRIITPGIKGRIVILHFPSFNILMAKYIGVEKLTFDGNSFSAGQIYLLENGSIIRGDSIESIYYKEIAGHFLKLEQEINYLKE